MIEQISSVSSAVRLRCPRSWGNSRACIGANSTVMTTAQKIALQNGRRIKAKSTVITASRIRKVRCSSILCMYGFLFRSRLLVPVWHYCRCRNIRTISTMRGGCPVRNTPCRNILPESQSTNAILSSSTMVVPITSSIGGSAAARFIMVKGVNNGIHDMILAIGPLGS